MIPTTIQYLIYRRWPVIRGLHVDKIILPVIYMASVALCFTPNVSLTFRFKYSAWMTVGVNSTVLSSILVGVTSQVWVRQYYPNWFCKYNFILGGELDQVLLD